MGWDGVINAIAGGLSGLSSGVQQQQARADTLREAERTERIATAKQKVEEAIAVIAANARTKAADTAAGATTGAATIRAEAEKSVGAGHDSANAAIGAGHDATAATVGAGHDATAVKVGAGHDTTAVTVGAGHDKASDYSANQHRIGALGSARIGADATLGAANIGATSREKIAGEHEEGIRTRHDNDFPINSAISAYAAQSRAQRPVAGGVTVGADGKISLGGATASSVPSFNSFMQSFDPRAFMNPAPGPTPTRDMQFAPSEPQFPLPSLQDVAPPESALRPPPGVKGRVPVAPKAAPAAAPAAVAPAAPAPAAAPPAVAAKDQPLPAATAVGDVVIRDGRRLIVSEVSPDGGVKLAPATKPAAVGDVHILNGKRYRVLVIKDGQAQLEAAQ